MQIYNDQRIIAEIVLASNVYFVTAYGDELPAISMRFNKWSSFPDSVDRIVERDGVRYLLLYDEHGMVKEDVVIGPIED